ncbi:MAG TPA: hypothetical protein VI875_04590 [Candidatus Norongarragalinales archaeon]|nr:hypothetical protein [Candidatus Norongarragalinales archaeon]
MVEEHEFTRIVARRIARLRIPKEAVMAVFGETEKRLHALEIPDYGNMNEIRIYLRTVGGWDHDKIDVAERECGQVIYHLDRIKSEVWVSDVTGVGRARYISIKPGRIARNFEHFAEELRKKLAEK